MEKLFAEANEYFEKETKLREKVSVEVKKMDPISRQLQMIYQGIHSPKLSTADVCQQALPVWQSLKPIIHGLDSIVSKELFHRFSSQITNRVSPLVPLAVLHHYLLTLELASRDQIAVLIGISECANITLSLEDYLFGVCCLPSELSRYAVNCVTREDYKTPVHIQAFVGDLYGGLLKLNLKNDNLRKKFDSVKYDKKKIEDMIYDLSIRGLLAKEK